MSKSINLITGYHIENTLVDSKGRAFPESIRQHNASMKVNDIRKLNGHTIDIEDINR